VTGFRPTDMCERAWVDGLAYFAAFEDGGDDAAYMAHVIGIAARAHGGMTKLAKETGMTRAGLYKALSKDGNPSFETIVKAMRVLGVRLVPQLAPSR
jgi:probable addiction module antidote protein